MTSLAETVTNAWYGGKKWLLCLLPLTAIYWFVVSVRKFCYKIGLLKSASVPVPVVVVGNLTVGGTGKSPLTAYLVNELKKRGFSPGIISRGYGGKSHHYPLMVNADTRTGEAGDEPVMLHQMTHRPVAVDPIRSRAATKLCNEQGCDLIVCDDGLQHYALSRDIEICVIDGKRKLGNGFLLPSGPLREPRKRLSGVDFVIVNGERSHGVPLLGAGDNDGLFGMKLEPGSLVNLFDGRFWPISQLPEQRFHAVAGIGNPERFFNALRALGVKVTPHGYPDHHPFLERDLMFEDDLPVVMTQKDAVKCRQLYNNGKPGNSNGKPDNLWYMPVSAVIDEPFLDRLCRRLEEIK